MNDDANGVFELVLAEDRYYREKVGKLQIALKKLSVETYFVDSEGNVTER